MPPVRSFSLPALAAGLTLLLAAPPAASQAENPYATASDVAEGERLFQRNCVICHGGDATGGLGPDLTRGFFRHAASDQQLFGVVRRGIEGTGMPSTGLDDQQAWQVVSYLRTLGESGRTALSGDPDRGRELFFGEGACATCHMVDGRGSRQGPDLSRIGWLRGSEFLRASLLEPNAEVEPRWWTARVVTTDGRRASGYLVEEDQFGVRLLDADDRLLSFRKSNLEEFERIKTSRMPSYRESLADEEIDDLVAYLAGLRGGESDR